jgi:hypothetical protein
MDELTDPRLDRAFSEYAERTAASAPPPDLAGVRTIAARRRRTAMAATAALAAAVALPVLAQTTDLFAGGVGVQRPGGEGPGWFSYAPTTREPLPNTSPMNAIQFVDWNEVIIAVPANESGCAHGMAQFHLGLSLVDGVGYRVGGGYNREENPVVAYGDVTGDGVLDAALVVSCVDSTSRVNPPSVLLLVTGEPNLHTLGVAYSTKPRQPDGEGQDFITALRIEADGTIVFRVRTFEGLSECEWRGQWTNGSFVGSCQP